MILHVRMIFPCLPKIKRCCYCTRNLKLACLFIVIWSMLSTCHSYRMLLWPLCKLQFNANGTDLIEILNYMKWILFFVNMVTLLTSFAFLLGLFLGRLLYYSANLFVVTGMFSASIMLCHGITSIVYVYQSDCNDISDGLAHIVYFFVWCYFILVVNTYINEMHNGVS